MSSLPAGILGFHRSLPGYRATPLVEARNAAARLSLARLWVKDESYRFDLGAYKILGAAWAARCAMEAGAPREFVAASEGNHGRAVARAARWERIGARIFLPETAARERIERIRAEQAAVVLVDGDYDRAVAEALAAADEAGRVLISDTSVTGHETSPHHVMEGYSTLFREIDEQIDGDPEVVAVQMGVGSLAAAAVRHYGARVIGVEPEGADCIRRSRAAGRLVEATGPWDARLAGLNCGRPSLAALPILLAGLGDSGAVAPELAVKAVAWLAEDGVFTTPTGAAGLAGLAGFLATAPAPPASALVIATEGAPRIP